MMTRPIMGMESEPGPADSNKESAADPSCADSELEDDWDDEYRQFYPSTGNEIWYDQDLQAKQVAAAREKQYQMEQRMVAAELPPAKKPEAMGRCEEYREQRVSDASSDLGNVMSDDISRARDHDINSSQHEVVFLEPAKPAARGMEKHIIENHFSEVPPAFAAGDQPAQADPDPSALIRHRPRRASPLPTTALSRPALKAREQQQTIADRLLDAEDQPDDEKSGHNEKPTEFDDWQFIDQEECNRCMHEYYEQLPKKMVDPELAWHVLRSTWEDGRQVWPDEIEGWYIVGYSLCCNHMWPKALGLTRLLQRCDIDLTHHMVCMIISNGIERRAVVIEANMRGLYETGGSKFMRPTQHRGYKNFVRARKWNGEYIPLGEFIAFRKRWETKQTKVEWPKCDEVESNTCQDFAYFVLHWLDITVGKKNYDPPSVPTKVTQQVACRLLHFFIKVGILFGAANMPRGFP